jgi:Zn-dependent protease with chaperone function
VVAHELGHIRSKDIGLMTLFAIVTGGLDKGAEILRGRQSKLGGSTALGLAILLNAISKILVPIGRGALSLLRELSADALGALYVGSPKPLMDGLQRLEDEITRKGLRKKANAGVLGDLMITHPRTPDRIRMLKSYETN